MSPSRIVVVGASLAGLNTIESLRSEGFDGEIIAVGLERELPYDRPPLSKEYLTAGASPAPPLLRETREIEALGVEWELGHAAVDLDPASRSIGLADGRRLAFDSLVIATGATARRVPVPEGMEGIHALRTIADADAVRAGLEGGARVVVLGAGFIGAEVASSVKARGLDVTVLEAAPIPLGRVFGDEIGTACMALHRDHGVDLRCDTTVTGFIGGSRVEAVVTEDGGQIPADMVVIGIGAAPSTDWLESSGLVLQDGVVCDSTCATGLPGVYAAGDVARFHHPKYAESVRIEHWSNAVEQGMAVARNLLAGPGAARPYAPLPYFWSDQYGIKIQGAGRRQPGDRMLCVAGSVGSGDFVVLYGDGDRFNAVVAFGNEKTFIKYRRMLATGVSWSGAVPA